ncbi:MAG: NADH-quinone oxidoreductase subunit NuoE [Candidatus Hydrothermia bacterium]|nr:NADH-quinone oxidoreductase subunit NuoE [Candidatus Hydrothermia bacterium]
MQDKPAFIERYERSHSSLIPLLQKTQETFGYLPEDVLMEISEYLGIPLTRVLGVATFYAQFRFEPLGKYVIKTCHGTACHVNGAESIRQTLLEETGIDEGQTTKDGLISIERVACLGCCSLAPVIMINNRVYGKLNGETVRKLIRKLKKGGLDN